MLCGKRDIEGNTLYIFHVDMLSVDCQWLWVTSMNIGVGAAFFGSESSVVPKKRTCPNQRSTGTIGMAGPTVAICGELWQLRSRTFQRQPTSYSGTRRTNLSWSLMTLSSGILWKRRTNTPSHFLYEIPKKSGFSGVGDTGGCVVEKLAEPEHASSRFVVLLMC